MDDQTHKYGAYAYASNAFRCLFMPAAKKTDSFSYAAQ